MKNKLFIKTIPADRFTPVVVFRKLNAKVLLESATLEIGKSRYSIILLKEAFRIILDTNGVFRQDDKGVKNLSSNRKDYLKILKQYAKQIDVTSKNDLPIPACGIGYLGYETVTLFDKVKLSKQRDDIKIPDAIFIFGCIFAVFDHYKDEIHIAGIGKNNKIEREVDSVITKLLDNDFKAYEMNSTKFGYKGDIYEGKDDFIEGVKIIKEHINKGDIVQAVLSRKINIKTDLPPMDAYCRLRRENPSPYLFYFDFGDFQVLGASPELMVSLEDRTAMIKPIAGTRKRGQDKKEDLALERELLNDEKEKAEHLMLVDLARNDLGRTAKSGSVFPRDTFFVERYSHVMHIVSEIEAQLDKGYDAYDLIRTTFPAGTVSGAPKIKAMEIISKLEKLKRGPYAGLIGHFDINGNFDSCITIRSFVHKKDVYYVQSGAGIVYDSVPEKEFEETVYKAKASIRALGVDVS
ncbi:MAG: chorismate-binding protein [Candidatus Omnitrophica bacterium]|nr:chorismate-binding protein [Candidatus Omnitrophota bacterium]